MEGIENHPIPQDVTGFQFKLVGNMTVKQFAYLASGAVTAWIFYELPISPFIKLPIAFLSAVLGASLAFLPIEGRPMDVMVANFIKALFNPTLFVYQKTGGTFWLSKAVRPQKPDRKKTQESNLAGERLKTLLKIQPKPPGNKLDAQEATFFNYVSTLSPKGNFLPKQQPLPSIQSLPSTPHIISMSTSSVSPQDLLEKPTPKNLEINQEETESLKQKVRDLEKDLETARREEADLLQRQSASILPQHERLLGLEKQLQEVLFQKEQLTKQLVALQQRLDLQKKNVFTPGVAEVKTQTQNVRQIPKSMGKSIGIPIAPEAPNIISGIIKDPRGNPLTNILVEVKDNEGNPVRAFKTNGLGQFASATPLTNGVYTIQFEDPKGQNKFDTIEFMVKGEVILPIEVLSIDTREELRRSLFEEGTNKL